MKQFSVNLVAILSLTTFLVNLHFAKAERIQCNDGIDRLLKEVDEDIKSRSPVNQTNKAYCDILSIDGAYTMVRNGDIYGEHVGGEDDCFKQDFNILTKILNFTCLVNMEMVQKAVDEQSHKFISRKKRNFPTMDDIPDKPSGIVYGYWEDVCITGEIMICRANKEASNTDQLSMCMPINMDKCIIDCRGDAQLEGMCEQTDFMDEMKEKFSAFVLVAAQEQIKTTLRNSPTGLVEKFNCEKLS